jgi:hypothetical protein
MGTIKQGILGGFSGKVGTVIGASWKGINYMRSIPQHVKNPRTAGQVSQRSKKAAHSGSFFSCLFQNYVYSYLSGKSYFCPPSY